MSRRVNTWPRSFPFIIVGTVGRLCLLTENHSKKTADIQVVRASLKTQVLPQTDQYSWTLDYFHGCILLKCPMMYLHGLSLVVTFTLLDGPMGKKEAPAFITQLVGGTVFITLAYFSYVLCFSSGYSVKEGRTRLSCLTPKETEARRQ